MEPIVLPDPNEPRAVFRSHPADRSWAQATLTGLDPHPRPRVVPPS
jgi:hypothetical protein